MHNITLHPIWLTVMPVYEHCNGVGTILFSSLAFYLMITKTPPKARPFTKYLMMLQASITLVDVNYGFLFCPVSLFPAPAGLCYGIICSWFGLSGHVGNTLMVFSVSLCGMCVLYCFHYKYVSIGQLVGGDSHRNTHHVVFRAVTMFIYSIPWLFDLGRYHHFEDGTAYIEKNFPSLYILFENPELPTYSFDPTFFPAHRQFFLLSSLLNILLTAVVITYFVTNTFIRLSKQNALSEKTRQLQRKTMTLLIIQTIPPFAIQLAPILIYTASMVIVKLNPNISNGLICFQLTHAFFHTSILILSTPSYKEPLMFWQKKKTSVASLYSQR